MLRKYRQKRKAKRIGKTLIDHLEQKYGELAERQQAEKNTRNLKNKSFLDKINGENQK